MQINLQKQQRKTSLNYLIVKSSIFGIAINVIFIDKNIAKAERTPKRIVGLKFDKTKIKNPKIIVDPVIKIAFPVRLNVFFSLIEYSRSFISSLRLLWLSLIYLQAKCIE